MIDTYELRCLWRDVGARLGIAIIRLTNRGCSRLTARRLLDLANDYATRPLVVFESPAPRAPEYADDLYPLRDYRGPVDHSYDALR